MSQPILFVVSQTSTVCYLAPLWRLWLVGQSQISFIVLVNSVAAQQVRKENIDGLNWIEMKSNACDYLDQQFAVVRPKNLITSTGHSSKLEDEALQFASKHRLPTARIIDTWYAYRSRIGTLKEIDQINTKVLVIDEVAKIEAIVDGVPKNMIEIVGQPAWEHLPLLDNRNRSKVLFASQPIQHIYKTQLGYTEETVWNIILQARAMRPDLFTDLICALHPEGLDIAAKERDVVFTNNGPSYLKEVGTVIGMFSSLMTEALLSGLHVIAYRQSGVSKIRKCVPDVKLVKLFANPEELIDCFEGPATDLTQLLKSLRNSTMRLSNFCLGYGKT